MTLPLSSAQKIVLSDFYRKPDTKVAFNTSERRKIWDEFKTNRNVSKFRYLEEQVPAIFAEITKAIVNEKNIQPAVFSECVYAQAFADKFSLSVFENHINSEGVKFNFNGIAIANAEELTVRYSYSRSDKMVSLVQAGGAGGVDSALISFDKKIATMIELKEPYARTSAPDLPKYGEDGYLVSTEKFLIENPQFKSMLEEQINKKFNIFEHLGSNLSDFSLESIETAVTENYLGEKFADFICTEDSSGYLSLIPSSHVALWAELEGELRPTGRNSYPVWTPDKLLSVLLEKGGSVQADTVTMPLSSFKQSKARGGDNISRFKISPLFFVRSEDVNTTKGNVTFKLEAVKQNIPDITAKIDFRNLDVSEVKKFYTDKI
jgi:hypothetical protein